jgi:hypothetical protein
MAPSGIGNDRLSESSSRGPQEDDQPAHPHIIVSAIAIRPIGNGL